MNEFVDPYCYSGTRILKNKLGLKTAEALDRAERRITTVRAREKCPKGKFDLAHLRAIHRHLFQDVYEWAGEIRTVEISKGGSQFQPRKFIDTGMADVHSRLVKARFLSDLTAEDFAKQAATILGDINYVHPFREGNGRTQLQYLKQLAAHAGHDLDLTLFLGKDWIGASIAAHEGNYRKMAEVIAGAIIGPAA